MAVFTEASVDAVIRIKRVDGQVRLIADIRSLTANGDQVRRQGFDITDLISPARLAGATDLLGDVETRIKALWQIP